MTDTIIFLGAGATKSCDGPLTSEILPAIHRRGALPGASRSLERLRSFLEQEFHVTQESTEAEYPGLPLLMSLLDTAIDRRQDFNERWNLVTVSELRQQIEFGIWDVLEEQLVRAPTNNHWELFNRLFPSDGDEPCVISTNYDLLADTTLMYLSRLRSETGEAYLPDYRCSISNRVEAVGSPPSGVPVETPVGEPFGKLLKLHGSLNWLYCKTCRRLQLGASSSRLYADVIQRIAGPELGDAFTSDGDPCSDCGTRLRPLLVAPTHLKDYRNPHLTQVWFDAERSLRTARHVVFVGYSLPDDDVEVVYLLKRSLSRPDVTVTVIEYDPNNPDVAAADHPVGRRYRTLFGDQMEWHASGLDGWLSSNQ